MRDFLGDSFIKRKFKFSKDLYQLDKRNKGRTRDPKWDEPDESIHNYTCDIQEPTLANPPNLISSELPEPLWNGVDLVPQHSVAIDIDRPTLLVRSRTPGHYHLYVDVAVSWEKYEKLLLALKDCGVIEPGYYRASVQNKATYLRKDRWDKYACRSDEYIDEIRKDIQSYDSYDG